MAVQKDQLTEITGERTISPKYVSQRTLQYKTFLKRSIAEALQDAFHNHPDASLAKTKVGIEYATDRADFPSIVIKFYEKDIKNAGVGHQEWGPSPLDPNYNIGPPYEKFVKYFHRIYQGDIEFEIWAQSSLDRDKVVDALIEVIAMGEVSSEGLSFLERVYESIGKTPYSRFHFVALNTDDISGQGENQENVPWFTEDVLAYTTSYRLPMLGEFYSLTPTFTGGYELLKEVDVYPWDEADPEDTPPENFPEGVIPEDKYIKITRHQRVIPEPEPTKEKEVTGVLETSPTLETEPTLETRGS